MNAPTTCTETEIPSSSQQRWAAWTSTGASPTDNPYRRQTVTFKNVLDKQTGVPLVQVKKYGFDRSPFELRYMPGHPAAKAARDGEDDDGEREEAGEQRAHPLHPIASHRLEHGVPALLEGQAVGGIGDGHIVLLVTVTAE